MAAEELGTGVGWIADGDLFARALGLEMLEVTHERVRARLVAGPPPAGSRARPGG
jgi:hypothetical protein